MLVRPKRNFVDDCRGYGYPYEFSRNQMYDCERDGSCSVYFVRVGLGGFFYESSEFEKHFMIECQ